MQDKRVAWCASCPPVHTSRESNDWRPIKRVISGLINYSLLPFLSKDVSIRFLGPAVIIIPSEAKHTTEVIELQHSSHHYPPTYPPQYYSSRATAVTGREFATLHDAEHSTSQPRSVTFTLFIVLACSVKMSSKSKCHSPV